MIHYRYGNLLQSDAEALVNTVNCVGVMGKGIALQFKQAFPANYTAYQKACKAHTVKPGEMFVESALDYQLSDQNPLACLIPFGAH